MSECSCLSHVQMREKDARILELERHVDQNAYAQKDAEIARLRDALEEIANIPGHHCAPVDLARAALASTGKS